LVLVQPRLAIERLEDGKFRMRGIGPLEETEPGGGEKFLAWVMRQGQIRIEGGELQWVDHRSREPPLNLKQLNISLRNDGERHRLSFKGAFPASLCRDCAFATDITGNPFASADWKGEIYVRAEGLEVAGLPLALREHLPQQLAGRVGVEFWSDWKDAAPHRIEGHASVSGLRLPATGLRTAVSVPAAEARVHWSGDASDWQLALEDLRLRLSDKSWSVGEVTVDYTTDQSEISIGHVAVDELTAYAKSLLPEIDRKVADERWANWLERWVAYAPGGDIKDVRLVIEGPADAPKGFAVAADVLGWRHTGQDGVPSVSGLTGRVRADQRGGELNLSARSMVVDLSGIFRNPIKANQFSGRVSWRRADDAWRVEGEQLRIGNDDIQASGSFLLDWPDDEAASSRVKVNADFWAGKGERARSYYPVHYLPKGILAWMDWAFAGGYVERGTLVFDGKPREFPFANGDGRFEVRAQVRDAEYRFLEGWEPARRALVDLVVINQDVWVMSRAARLGALRADRISVHTQFPNGESMDHVDVALRVRGPVRETFRVLRAVQAPPSKAGWKRYLPDGIDAEGNAVLSLQLKVPFGGNPAEVRGEYELLGVNLQLPVAGIRPRDLEGSVLFNEAGVSGGRVTGRFLGGDASLQGYTSDGAVTIVGEGRMTADSMEPIIGERLASRLEGEGSWSGTWSSAKGGRIEGEIDWRNLRASLPAPLDREKGILPAKLSIRTLESAPTRHVVALDAPGHASGRIAFAPQGGGWRLERGMLSFGPEPARLPAEPGLHVVARSERLDADGWGRLLGDGEDNAGRAQGRLALDALTRVSLETSALELMNRRFDRVSVEATKDNQGRWTGRLHGPAAEGSFSYASADEVPRIALRFSQLQVAESAFREGEPGKTDPRNLPALTLSAESFRFGERDLGSLEFAASHAPRGWHIDKLQLARPEAKLEASGQWETRAGESSSALNVSLHSEDMGKTLEAGGYPDRMIGGKGEFKSQVSWRGGLPDFDLGALGGTMEFQIENGRLPEVRAGALGRLFAALDLTSIKRFLTFDFSPIYGKGLLFDKLGGKAAIEYGNLQLQETSMRVPAAKVELGGRIGFADQDFDLRVEVEPRVGDSAAIAGWAIWGPQVAAAVLAVQQVLKLAIREGAREVWLVKGPWSEPQVQLVRRTGIDEPKEGPAQN